MQSDSPPPRKKWLCSSLNSAVRPKKGSYTPVKHDCNQIRRIRTTGLGVLTWIPCLLRNRKLTYYHLLESLNGMSMNDTKDENCWDGNPNFYLWLTNAFILHLLLLRLLLLLQCYTYYYYTLTTIRSQAGPFWVRHFGRHLGPLWGSLGMVRRGPYSFTPQNRMIILPPAHTIGRGWPPPVLRNRGWGGDKRSVCNLEFTHVTHIVKKFMRVKYNRLHVIYIVRITNKIYFRSCALFRILDLLRIDPTSFCGGGEEAEKVCKIWIFAVIRVSAKRGYFM